MMKIETRQIWTIGHRPFAFGGRPYYPLACKVECSGPFSLGRGYKGYCATAPNGKVFVAEATTGAIVGNGVTSTRALEKVRRDIETGDPNIMKKQVAEAAEQVKEAELRDADFFWGALRCGKPSSVSSTEVKGE